MPAPVVIGLDLGTSALKAIVCEGGRVIAECAVAIETQRPLPAHSEQHPAHWIAAAERAFGLLRERAGERWSEVRAIGLSGQMHGLVALSASHEPLLPAILWNDARAEGQARFLRETYPQHAETAGVLCMAGFVAPKILWLASERPELFRAAASFVLPKDFLRLWLCGEIATDPSDAAGTWLFDERSRTWSEAICGDVGVEGRQLPPVRSGTSAIGALRPALSRQFALPPDVMVAAGAGDVVAASLGLGLREEGELMVTLGTSAQIFSIEQAYRPNIESVIHSFCHTLDATWFNMAAMLNGASALAWWSQACGAAIPTLLDEARALPADAAVPLFLPHLQGERTPHNAPHARGAFVELNGATGRAQMTRAVIEGIAFSLRDGLDALRGAGTDGKSAVLTGGGFQDPLMRQIVADVLDLPCSVPIDAATGPALGAAGLAEGMLGLSTSRSRAPGPAAQAYSPVPASRDLLMTRLAIWRSRFSQLTAPPAAGPVASGF